MTGSRTALAVLALALGFAALLSLFAAAGAAWLAHLEGEGAPSVLRRAAVAFASALALLVSILALGIDVLAAG
ncbi:hypothetical protein VR45_37935 [Streptomyces sp. NRRL S-495]|nr:hypothetical protein VR45_37935 [Streptomyces sp. NRRL S-495]